jgi:nitric oxide reductase NorE protein
MPTGRSSSFRVADSQEHVPGEIGIWVFIFGDLLVFSLFFLTYLSYRGADIAQFQQSQALLNINLGVLNTLLLLTSSWCVVTAICSIRRNDKVDARRRFTAAWLLGFSFVLVKIFEYSSKLKLGLTPVTDMFFMFYYILTGIHFLHVCIGLGVLAWQIRLTRNTYETTSRLSAAESGATYWHLVDLLWIILFPLLYLL